MKHLNTRAKGNVERTFNAKKPQPRPAPVITKTRFDELRKPQMKPIILDDEFFESTGIDPYDRVKEQEYLEHERQLEEKQAEEQRNLYY